MRLKAKYNPVPTAREKAFPSVSTLRELLDYDSETGALTWKARDARHFEAQSEHKAIAVAKSFNNRHAGNLALKEPRNGYPSGVLLRQTFYAHRVIWAIFYGEWPEQQIDHINHNRADNRIVNLRLASHTQNMRNQPMKKNNTSGVTGVSWDVSSKKWQATIRAEGRRIHLGHFCEKQAAVDARLNAEKTWDYHPNHGRRCDGL